jgi:hypothetical protein
VEMQEISRRTLLKGGGAAVTGLSVPVVEPLLRAETEGHLVLRDGLQLANARVGSVQPLTPTIGDEFQGLYPDQIVEDD